MILKLAVHGAKQKGSDVYAGASEKEWTIGDCEEATKRVCDNLVNGVWADRSTGTGGRLTVALFRVTDRSVEDCAAAVAGMDDAAKRALRKDARIASALADLAAEAATRKASAGTGTQVDLDAIIG